MTYESGCTEIGTNADVKIDGRVNGKIDDGLLVLLGVGNAVIQKKI